MRVLTTLLLLACLARAEDVVVRVTAENQPVENAAIKVLKKGDDIVFDRTNWAADKLTDDIGQAVVDVPEDGKVLVYVPGYALAVTTVDRWPLDVELKPERIYKGRVVDSAGKPISGADVRLHTDFKRRAEFLAKTDKEGRYFVYGLWLDDYEVHAWPDGYVFASRKGTTLVFRRTASIEGAFVDKDGKPVGGLELDSTLRIVDEEGNTRPMDPFLDTEVAKDGRFTVKDLEPGDYSFYPKGPWGGSVRVELREGEHRKGVRLVVFPPATLKMRFVDTEGKPVDGAGLQFGKKRSGPDGRFTTQVVPNARSKLRLARKHDFERVYEYGPEAPGSERDVGDIVFKTIRPATVVVRLPDGRLAQDGTVDRVQLRNGRATIPEPGMCFIKVAGFPEVAFKAPGELQLPALRWLEGTVLDGKGQPVRDATVRCSDRSVYPAATTATDAEGKFRIGPFAGPRVSVLIEKAGKRPVSRDVVLSDGRLLVEMIDLAPTWMLRGIVTRGGRPAEDFWVHGLRFLDEAGRFEVSVDPNETKWLSYGAGKMRYVMPLPATPEAPLEIRLPDGRISVELAAVQSKILVMLRQRNAEWPAPVIAEQTIREPGVLHFDGIEPGVYTVSAQGYEAAEARPGETIRLKQATGSLRVLLPPGAYMPDAPPKEVGAGRHVVTATLKGVQIDGIAEVVRGRETVLDLAGRTELLMRGEAQESWRLVGSSVTYWGAFDAAGAARFQHVIAGEYKLFAGVHQRTVEIRGASVRIELLDGGATLTGVVRIGEGRPAQGASVALVSPDDDWQVPRWSGFTDLAGSFRIERLPPGTYTCVVRLPGYAHYAAPVEIDGEGSVALNVALTKAVGVYVRVLGLRGEPLRKVAARVDGVLQLTDALGRLTLDRVPATVDIEHEGYESVRGLQVTRAGDIKLTRGASLVILFDPEAGELEVEIGGEVWELPRARNGRLVLKGLPPRPLRVTQTPPPPEEDENQGGEGDEDEESGEGEQGAAQVVETRLIAGETVTIDLRD